MTVRLQQFSDEYATAVVELVHGILRDEFGFSGAAAEQTDLSDIRQHYGRGANNFWIAVDESGLVGTTGFVDLGRKQGLLRKMFVRSDCRGSGVAGLLLDNALKWATARGFVEIYLGTNSKFHAAQRFYTKHGFGMTFNTAECQTPDTVRVVCKVVHTAGHSEQYQIDMPADGKGAKGGDVMTKTHATGSGTSYGMRYLLKMIWNVATAERDDDGNAAGGHPEPQAPAGFETWWDDLQTVAEDGLPALKAAWDQSDQKFKSYLTKQNLRGWEVLKSRAAKVVKS